MELITNNLSGFWFGLGFLLLAIEILVFGFGSGVLLFGGVGALITGALIYFNVIPEVWLPSIASFTLASAAAAIVLWLPFKKLQGGSELGNDQSSDLIGHKFRLASELTYNRSANTRYSGVDWRVELSDEASGGRLEAGTQVAVKAVNAGIFYVDAA